MPSRQTPIATNGKQERVFGESALRLSWVRPCMLVLATVFARIGVLLR